MKTQGVLYDQPWNRVTTQERLYMLYIYPKNAQEDLTDKQLKFLRTIVESEFK